MQMRYLIALLMFGFSLSADAANVPHDAALEKLQAKIVARFYQTTYGAKARCPADYVAQFEATLSRFRDTYPELMQKIDQSPYLDAAKQRYKQDEDAAKSEPQDKLTQECLSVQEFLGVLMDTPSGKAAVQSAFNDLTTVKPSPDTEELAPPQLWSDHKQLSISVHACGLKGYGALLALGFSSVVQNGDYSYGNFLANRAAVKCVANDKGSFVYVAVAGQHKDIVEKLRNEVMRKMQ
jgi:hypothetical protein